MKNKISLSVVTALCLTTLSLNAYEMKPVGFKAMGMGGTGVASTRGSLSGYYNPALLRFSDYTAEFSANLGLRLRDSNVIDNVDTLNKIDFETTMDNIATGTTTATDRANIINAQNTLNKIGTNNAFMLSATPSLTAQMSDALAIGVYANLDVGLRLNIDTNHLDLIFDTGSGATGYQYFNPNDGSYTDSDLATYQSSSLEYAINSNNGLTYIQVDTMALVETPISYAEAFEKANGTYSLGISLKPMNLVTSSQKVNLGKSSSQADSDEATYETTYKPTIGLDLGFAYVPRDSGVTFGLVGKNINSPKFKVDKSNTGITEAYKIDPFFRAGVSMSVLDDNAEFAFDVDLQKSDTLILGEETQNIGAGLEFHPSSWFSFRVGAMQDIASEKFDDGTILTTGIGFGLKWAQIDLSAMASTKSGEYDGQTIPRYTALNLSLVSRWGDGYNKKIPEGQEEAHDYENDDSLTFEEKRRLQKDAQRAQDELDKEVK
ncbi:MAG: hypothetical protein DRG78_04340 [Epsilonproteobacteria bacterium]|nr:MAG: hypothetical protein DRG78_04340 [Campylobacterota bacterium]